MKSQERILRGVIRNSVTTENKLLAKEGKRVCSNTKCRKIFIKTSSSSIRCKECEAEKYRKYREKNLDKVKAKQAEWRDSNRSSINSKRKERWIRERR